MTANNVSDSVSVSKADRDASPSDSNVAVYVDSQIHPLRSRRVYWRTAVREDPTRHLEEISVSDLKEKADGGEEVQFPRLREYGIIVVNWDVANGDFQFFSDETLAYMRLRGRFDFERWANAGARIVVEVQSASTRPIQEAYDSIVGSGQVEVCPIQLDYSELSTKHLVANKSAKTHPLVRRLMACNGLIFSRYSPTDDEAFEGVQSDSAQGSNRMGKPNDWGGVTVKREIDPRDIAWGFFEKWSRDWTPLIFREKRIPVPIRLSDEWQHIFTRDREQTIPQKPVALSKQIGSKGGEIILTTMRIAASGNSDLIDAFLNSSGTCQERLRQTKIFYRHREMARVFRRTLFVAAIWGIGLAIAIPLAALLDEAFRFALPEQHVIIFDRQISFPDLPITGVSLVGAASLLWGWTTKIWSAPEER